MQSSEEDPMTRLCPLRGSWIVQAAALLANVCAWPLVAFSIEPARVRFLPSSSLPSSRGICTPATLAHTNHDFQTAPVIVQAGFVESEVAAASYVLPASDFPLRLDRTETIFGTSGATVATTTQWSLLIWEGVPSAPPVLTFSSDGIVIPHLVLPPGTSGAIIQVDFAPSGPDQVILNDNGSHTISVGYRIDEHNNQTQNPCFTAPPSNSNAFPTIDVSGLAQPTQNWLFGVNCGPFGCPANGGWARFSALPGFCRPSGDWVLRATVTSASAVEVPNSTCSDGADNDCDGFIDCDDSDCAIDLVCAALAVAEPGLSSTGLSLEIESPAVDGRAEMRVLAAAAGAFTLDVYDSRGARIERLAEGDFPSGEHTFAFDGSADGRALPSGLYFVRLVPAAGSPTVRKLVWVR
jgi:hypothetical protein